MSSPATISLPSLLPLPSLLSESVHSIQTQTQEQRQEYNESSSGKKSVGRKRKSNAVSTFQMEQEHSADELGKPMGPEEGKKEKQRIRGMEMKM